MVLCPWADVAPRHDCLCQGLYLTIYMALPSLLSHPPWLFLREHSQAQPQHYLKKRHFKKAKSSLFTTEIANVQTPCWALHGSCLIYFSQQLRRLALFSSTFYWCRGWGPKYMRNSFKVTQLEKGKCHMQVHTGMHKGHTLYSLSYIRPDPSDEASIWYLLSMRPDDGNNSFKNSEKRMERWFSG